MTFTFVSNYINHHQQPFCDAMYEIMGSDFAFVATMPMEKERVDMGWDTSLNERPYVKLLYEDPSCEQLILDSDVVLLGWSEREDIAQKRLNTGRVTLRVSERLYREGTHKAISPRGLIHKYREHIRFRKKPVYMLCAGAYAAADFRLIGAYPDKLLKWGYFPPFMEYDIADIEKKLTAPESYEIVWAGRLIPLKHPEYMLKLARTLKNEGVRFHIHMIGDGEMRDSLFEEVQTDLSDAVIMHGAMKPEEVRTLMSKSHIHISTSNHLEGWGAVINEGMNAGCIEIACNLMGAVPFLIEDNGNGLIYKHDICEEMEQVVIRVLRNWRGYIHLGPRAYETIKSEWNARTAARRLYEFTSALSEGRELPVYESGPLSPAPIIRSASDNAIYDFGDYFKL